jgi:hypothetical protein
MRLAHTALLAIAITGITAGGAVAQNLSLLSDVVYETPRPVYAVPLATYLTPEIALASPVSFAIGERGLGQRHARWKGEFAAPAFYGDVVSRGDYPTMTASRCITDLGYGRWEGCD